MAAVAHADLLFFDTPLDNTIHLPPKSNMGKGLAHLSLDTVTKQVGWRITYSELGSPVSAVGCVAGSLGPAFILAAPGARDAASHWSFEKGSPVTTTALLGASATFGLTALTDGQIAALKAGHWICAVATEASGGDTVIGGRPIADPDASGSVRAKLLPIMGQLSNCTRAIYDDPGFQPVRPHLAAGPPTPDQLSDAASPTEQELSILKVYNPKIRACQNDILQTLSTAMPLFAPVFSTMFANQEENFADLQQGKRTWGQYNRRNAEIRDEFGRNLVAEVRKTP